MRKSALSSMSEIERYYNSKVRKSPHVVAHYAAGARLIGLTEKQMAKRLATLSVSGGENNGSPYARPVWTDFGSTIPRKLVKGHKGKGKIRLMIISKKKEEDKCEDLEENSPHSESGDGLVSSYMHDGYSLCVKCMISIHDCISLLSRM